MKDNKMNQPVYIFDR